MRSARMTVLLPLVLVLAGGNAVAATLRGHVQLVDKDGRSADDLAAAVVWVEGPKLKPKPASATIEMRNKGFVPRVVVVPVGGTVQFPNTDPVFHNVFSASGENRFDLDLYKTPKSGAQTFQHPGRVRVYCNIHPQMSAFVLVRDNPFWSRVGKDGSFSIEGVPPGTWSVKAWHERAGEATVSTTIEAEGGQELVIPLDASRFKRAPHKNKFGKDYDAGAAY